jgi:hypothetical protein
LFFASAGVLSKHPIFPTASKKRGRSGCLLLRSKPRVPVVYLVGHLIGILAILLCYFLLWSLLYCSWARDVQKHEIFSLPNTIQIMTSIYFGPTHRALPDDQIGKPNSSWLGQLLWNWQLSLYL